MQITLDPARIVVMFTKFVRFYLLKYNPQFGEDKKGLIHSNSLQNNICFFLCLLANNQKINYLLKLTSV